MYGPNLKTKRLILRPIKVAEASILSSLASKDVARYFDAIPYPNTPASEAKWIRSVRKRKDSIEWGISLEDNQIIGSIAITGYNPKSRYNNLCLSYWIGKKYWGQGYASEAARKVLEYAFKVLKVQKVHASASNKNIASNKILKKIGMKLEGKLRKNSANRFSKEIEDKIEYGILRNEWK